MKVAWKEFVSGIIELVIKLGLCVMAVTLLVTCGCMFWKWQRQKNMQHVSILVTPEESTDLKAAHPQEKMNKSKMSDVRRSKKIEMGWNGFTLVINDNSSISPEELVDALPQIKPEIDQKEQQYKVETSPPDINKIEPTGSHEQEATTTLKQEETIKAETELWLDGQLGCLLLLWYSGSKNQLARYVWEPGESISQKKVKTSGDIHANPGPSEVNAKDARNHADFLGMKKVTVHGIDPKRFAELGITAEGDFHWSIGNGTYNCLSSICIKTKKHSWEDYDTFKGHCAEIHDIQLLGVNSYRTDKLRTLQTVQKFDQANKIKCKNEKCEATFFTHQKRTYHMSSKNKSKICPYKPAAANQSQDPAPHGSNSNCPAPTALSPTTSSGYSSKASFSPVALSLSTSAPQQMSFIEELIQTYNKELDVIKTARKLAEARREVPNFSLKKVTDVLKEQLDIITKIEGLKKEYETCKQVVDVSQLRPLEDAIQRLRDELKVVEWTLKLAEVKREALKFQLETEDLSELRILEHKKLEEVKNLAKLHKQAVEATTSQADSTSPCLRGVEEKSSTAPEEAVGCHL